MKTQEELINEFNIVKDQLMAFILRMVTSQQDTEDIYQETYIKAVEKLESFRGESSLKTWIFAIASNKSKDFLRSKNRWPESATDICKEAALSDPDHFAEAMKIVQSSNYANFEIREHIAFCFTCISKSLPLEQHLVILLKEIHNFKIREVAEILKIDAEMVKYHLKTARKKMVDIFADRCSLINKEGMCHQCTEINGIFNPKQDVQAELVKIKLFKDRNNPDKEHLLDLRLKIVEEIDPFNSGAKDLQLHHLEFNNKTINKFLEK